MEIRPRGCYIRLQMQREGLDGASANSQRHQNCPSYHILTRGTRTVHHQTRGIRIIHLLSSWIIFKFGADGVAGQMIIFQYERFLRSCCLRLIQYVCYCQPRKDIFMEENNIAKEKGKVIRLILSHSLLFFSSIVSLKTERLTKKSKWQTKSIVVCVPRHLLIGVVFVIIKRSTMAGKRGTIAASATNHWPLIVV